MAENGNLIRDEFPSTSHNNPFYGSVPSGGIAQHVGAKSNLTSGRLTRKTIGVLATIGLVAVVAVAAVLNVASDTVHHRDTENYKREALSLPVNSEVGSGPVIQSIMDDFLDWNKKKAEEGTAKGGAKQDEQLAENDKWKDWASGANKGAKPDDKKTMSVGSDGADDLKTESIWDDFFDGSKDWTKTGTDKMDEQKSENDKWKDWASKSNKPAADPKAEGKEKMSLFPGFPDFPPFFDDSKGGDDSAKSPSWPGMGDGLKQNEDQAAIGKGWIDKQKPKAKPAEPKPKAGESKTEMSSAKAEVQNFWDDLLDIAKDLKSPQVPDDVDAPAPMAFWDKFLKSGGAIATDNKQSVACGRTAMKRGGTAVEIAIAVAFCSFVVNPHKASLGGSAVIQVYARFPPASVSPPVVYDGIATAPLAASLPVANMSEGEARKHLVGVPGALSALVNAHGLNEGRLKLRSLILPAMFLALKGVKVSKDLADALKQHNETIYNDPGLNATFINKTTGEPLKEGDVLKQIKLALTLAKIAFRGAESFYTGAVADKLLNDTQGANISLSAADLAGYKTVKYSALKVPLPSTGHTIFVPSLPTEGPVVALASLILSGFNATDNEVLRAHRVIEATKLALVYGTLFGDPDTKFNSLEEVIANATSKSFADNLRDKINDHSTMNQSEYGVVRNIPSLEEAMSFVDVIGPKGGACSIVLSLGKVFGNGFQSPQTGVILNSALSQFSTNQNAALENSTSNTIQAGKRPLSAMNSVIAVNDLTGDTAFVANGDGRGASMAPALIQLVSNSLINKINPAEAAKLPKITPVLNSNSVEVTSKMQLGVAKGLHDKQHTLVQVESGPQLGLVARTAGQTGVLTAVSPVKGAVLHDSKMPKFPVFP